MLRSRNLRRPSVQNGLGVRDLKSKVYKISNIFTGQVRKDEKFLKRLCVLIKGPKLPLGKNKWSAEIARLNPRHQKVCTTKNCCCVKTAYKDLLSVSILAEVKMVQKT
jgi:hypothetical protein